MFNAGGARLVLCGKNWEGLESLYAALTSVADPSKVRLSPDSLRNLWIP